MVIHELKCFLKCLPAIKRLIVAFCIAAVLASCHNSVKDTSHYNKIIDDALKIYNFGEKSNALHFLDSAFSHSSNLPPIIQYKIYNFKKIYYYYRHDYDRSYVYADSMLDALENNHVTQQYPVEYANALNVKADFYYDKNILNKAFEYYFKSRVVAEGNGDTCALGNQSYHLGMISYRQEKYKDAIIFFKESLAENGKCSDDAITFYRSQELINNIALSFNKLKDYDSALFYYHSALDFISNKSKSLKDDHTRFTEMATGVILGNIAKIFIAKNMPDSAEALLKQSIAINLKPGNDQGDALLDRMQLAELYYKINNIPNTETTLHEIKQILDTLPADVNYAYAVNEVKMRWTHLMFEYFQHNKQPEPALEYLINYEKIKDSIETTNKELNQINVNQLVEYSETHHKNELLTKNNELAKLYLWLIIGFCIFVMLIIGLVYHNYRKSKKHVDELTILNQQVNEQKAHVEFAVTQLQKNNEDKDKMLHMVVHDLRNPINGIIFLSDMLLDEQITGEQRENLEMVMSAAQSCSTLINDLLEVSTEKLYEDKAKKAIEDANELVKYVVNLMQFRVLDKKQTVKLTLSDKPAYVFVNKDKIRRILSNIISNAIKFSPPKSLIEVSVYKTNEFVTIKVKDSGIGIPDTMKPFIFDMFTTSKRYGTEGEKSFGLGLYICRQIIEANGGEIWFDSEENKGSVFFIELPEID